MCTAGADGLCRTSCGTPLGKVVTDLDSLEIEVSNKPPVDTAAECGEEFPVLCDSTLTYLLAVFVECKVVKVVVEVGEENGKEYPKDTLDNKLKGLSS